MHRIAKAGTLVAAVLVLSACGAASLAREEPMAEPSMGVVSQEALGGADADFAANESAPAALPEPQRASFAAGEQAVERVVIRSANLSIVVPEPTDSVQEITRLAEEMDGFVVSSNVSQTFFADAGVSADRASITIRVPAERLDEALERIRQGATEVQVENVSGQDVTQEFTDLQSRLRNLEAAESRLLEIMDAATDTEDVLNVFNQLTQVQEQIEVVKGRIQYLSESAALSAISVDLIPDVAAQPLQIGGWQPEGTAKEAFTALIQALRFLGDAAIWAGICIVPVGLIFGIPGYFAGRALLRRRRAERDGATAANKPAAKK